MMIGGAAAPVASQWLINRGRLALVVRGIRPDGLGLGDLVLSSGSATSQPSTEPPMLPSGD